MKQEEREELLKLTTLAEEQICSHEDTLAGTFKVHNDQSSETLEEPSTQRGKAKKLICVFRIQIKVFLKGI